MLNQGADPILEDISRDVGITKRHARRLIVQLRMQGTHVQERRDGKKKRFFLKPEHRHKVRGIEFEEEEMHALAVAAVAAKSELRRTPLEQPLCDPLPKCFSPCRYLHKPLWPLPTGATVVGRDSHPLQESAFPRRTLDRLIHNAHRIALKGDSMRKQLAKMAEMTEQSGHPHS